MAIPRRIESHNIDVDDVRRHYDQLSHVYARFWGGHIHHGFWTGDKSEDPSPAAAQERLVAELARRAGVEPRSKVIDLGCGIGGSSIWLARDLECSVLGITISPVQVRVAEGKARSAGVSHQVRFAEADMSSLNLMETFDAAWIIESTEHLADKKTFFRHLARIVRPRGFAAICAWLQGTPSDDHLLDNICEAMLCPDLGRMRDYLQWLNEAGFSVLMADDVTPNVARTWEHCSRIAMLPAVRSLIQFSDPKIRRFVEAFPLMTRAYETGAMQYGLIVAQKT